MDDNIVLENEHIILKLPNQNQSEVSSWLADFSKMIKHEKNIAHSMMVNKIEILQKVINAQPNIRPVLSPSIYSEPLDSNKMILPQKGKKKHALNLKRNTSLMSWGLVREHLISILQT